MNKAEPDSYIARHSCGRIVAWVSTDDPKLAARETAEWIRRGEIIEPYVTANARTAEWCDCFRKSK